MQNADTLSYKLSVNQRNVGCEQTLSGRFSQLSATCTICSAQAVYSFVVIIRTWLYRLILSILIILFLLFYIQLFGYFCCKHVNKRSVLSIQYFLECPLTDRLPFTRFSARSDPFFAPPTIRSMPSGWEDITTIALFSSTVWPVPIYRPAAYTTSAAIDRYSYRLHSEAGIQVKK